MPINATIPGPIREINLPSTAIGPRQLFRSRFDCKRKRATLTVHRGTRHSLQNGAHHAMLLLRFDGSSGLRSTF